MSEKILVIDDERDIANLLEVYLQNENYIVYKYYCAKDAMPCIENEDIDLAILDVMLPDMDGFSLCQLIREKYTYPIIMLTAKIEETDKITGLTLGADDYVTKPFRPLEVVARVNVAGSAKLINYDSTGLKIACTVVILIIGFIAFRYTKFGTYLKAIGAGEKAAMFSGIRTDKMKFLIYVLAGAITGFAAFINVIKVGSVTSSGGNQLETQILIALVLGGMPISGGAKVRFENIVVGSLLYIVLNSGLTMMGFTTQMMQLIQGVVFLIFVAVFADRESIQVIK